MSIWAVRMWMIYTTATLLTLSQRLRGLLRSRDRQVPNQRTVDSSKASDLEAHESEGSEVVTQRDELSTTLHSLCQNTAYFPLTCHW